MNETAFRLLTEMEERLRSNPEYMANLFAIYQQQTESDNEKLAEELHIKLETLLRLALCKCPDTNSDTFMAQVEQLAGYAGVKSIILSGVIKRARLSPKEVPPVKTPIMVGEVIPELSSQPAIRRLVAAFSSRLTPVIASALILVAVSVVYLNRKAIVSQWIFNAGGQSVPETVRESIELPQETPAGGELIAKAVSEKMPDAKSTAKLSSKQPGKRAPQDLQAMIFVRVDLDEYRTFREIQTEEENRRAIRLPRSRTRISFKLPAGSANGTYLVQVVDAFNKPLVTGKAKSVNGKTLDVTLDAGNLEEKSYRLCISRKDEAPDYYLVIVEKYRNSKK
jgi:hypothetical protein